MTRSPSYENLFKCFLTDVEKRKNIDYCDKNSIRRYNAAMDRIIKVSRQISEMYPDHIDEFSSLLNSDDIKLQLTCACMMVQFMNCTEKQLYRAQKWIIEYCCNYANGAEKMAFEVMFEKHPPKSKEILDMISEKNPFYAEPINIAELRKRLNSFNSNNQQ